MRQLIRFNHVSMSYQSGAPLALDDVSFEIQEGEFVFVIGRSGSGKSTIVKLLTCEEKPNAGDVFVGDYCLNRLKRRWVPYLRRNIGMVFQDFRLIPTKTIFENVAFSLEILGYSKKTIKRQVLMVLSTVGLRHREHAFPHELSGGEQQRVAIARAMVNNPSVLLADEPTGNLDPINSETIMALLEEINRMGTTVVVCTHDKEMVNRMKRRVVVIDQGHLVRDDTGGTFERKPQSPIQAESGQGLNVAGVVAEPELLDELIEEAANEVDVQRPASTLLSTEEIAEKPFEDLPKPEAVEALYESPVTEPLHVVSSPYADLQMPEVTEPESVIYKDLSVSEVKEKIEASEKPASDWVEDDLQTDQKEG